MPKLRLLFVPLIFVLAWAALAAQGCAVPMEGAAPARPQASPRCLMGSNGVQACGYNCMMGSDGVSACANTPNGVCAMGTDGHVQCSQVQGSQPAGPPPECKMGSRGERTCGYNCRMGSNGYWYCATTANGQCAMSSDGSWTCP